MHLTHTRFAVRAAAVYLLGVTLLLGAPAFGATLPDFAGLVEQVSPAVVNISTKQNLEGENPQAPNGFPIPEFPPGSPWEDFFRRFFDEQGPEQFESRSLGSGFIIDAEGYILTNNHVVEGADEIVVRLSDRREVVAEVVGADARSDIALLKVEATDLPAARLSKRKLRVGEWVMAIGSPFGFDHSVSVGVVSALGRSLPSESYVPFIQTDVAINPGNSGGPLYNLEGEVVGINSQIYSRTGGYMGVSFAIPVDVAMDVVAQLREKGYVTRGWLGVLIQDVTRELAESFGMSKPAGALVAKVMAGSPGAKAGIEVGDVIVEYDGKSIGNSSELPPLVGRTNIGTEVSVKVIRNGKPRAIKVRIGELPEEEELAATDKAPRSAADNRLGLAVADLAAEQRKQRELEKHGVAVTDVQDGPAYRAGIRRGDILLKLNNVSIESASHFRRLVQDLPAGKSVPVLVLRRSGPLFLALRVPEK